MPEAARSSRKCSSSLMQPPHHLDSVGLFRLFVLPIADHAREPKREPTRIDLAFLETVEGDFDDELRTHVDDDPFATRLELLQFLRLPREQLVGHSLARLAEHH